MAGDEIYFYIKVEKPTVVLGSQSAGNLDLEKEHRYVIKTTLTALVPTLGTFNVPTKNVGDSAFVLTAPSSNSTGAFSYTSSDSSVATISGSTVTIVGSGTTTITATQTATLNYTSGSVTTSFTVTPASPPLEPIWKSISGYNYNPADLNGQVYSIVKDSNGIIYVGGSFGQLTKSDGTSLTVNNIAKWDGTQWSALGSGLTNIVFSIVIDSNDNIYAGGSFTTLADGTTVNYIAKWDGTQWSALGSGLNGSVKYLAIDSNDHIYACGYFTYAGDTTVNNIAKWDGTQWSSLGSVIFSNTSYSLIMNSIVSNGNNIYVAGAFSQLTKSDGTTIDVNGIAKWDGTEWSALGSGLTNNLISLAIDSNNILYASGNFTISGTTSLKRIAKWDGTEWSALGNGLNGAASSIAIDSNDNIYAGGGFTLAGSTTVNRIAKWDGTEWSALGSGLNGTVRSLLIGNNNTVYAGGSFTGAGGDTNIKYIAKYE
jgi:hypothetical protein